VNQDYALFGLKIASEIPLGPLPPGRKDAAADVVIAYGAAPAGAHPPGYSLGEAGTILHILKVGTFLIREGREILVSPAPGASDRNIRLYLLGSAFGALLHQRGLMPLHANAIEMDGRAIAFCGHSGAGKSTLAAWFHDRGYGIFADDVCVIGADPSGAPLAYPGLPRLRLWREALEASGRAADHYDRSFDEMDKYDVPTAGAGSPAPMKLAAIYLLRQAGEGAEPRIDRLGGVDMVEALVSNTYRGGYLKTIGRTGDHLAACLRIGRKVPVFRAERIWGFESFDAQARLLEAHARAQVEASGS
jgi:hypothetical protein